MRKKETNQKIIIWALYDDAEHSYTKAIKKFFANDYDIEVHCFGINQKSIKFPKGNQYFYHELDLSLLNLNLFNYLNKLTPPPTIILASPPCESWSGADCNGKMFRSIDKHGNWIVKNKKHYDEHNQNSHPVKRRYFSQKETGRILGEATIGATIQIIQKFKPKFWIIENPQTSKTWEFQENHWDFYGNKNLAYYSAYDQKFSPKPTIFKSNIKLNLKNKRVPGNNSHMSRGSYNRRSAIPESLVKEILSQVISNE